ncbi:MAG: hypothetical protein OEX04_04505 [Acidimicrobiia bacterium]|nr:hypothetical protein [Acidimicrobiia bacterium]MDH4306717.1 hypothetical protein [Acidimicrobiia bacterium]MDH5292680.1 hypothetical protein [Acidimicrobiia bacterium]
MTRIHRSIVLLLVAAACTTSPPRSGPDQTTESTLPPATAATIGPATTGSTAPRASDVVLDLEVELEGTQYLFPATACSDDTNEVRAAAKALEALAVTGVRELASGWPTTTIAPGADLAAFNAEIDRNAVAAVAAAVTLGRESAALNEWSNLNERYASLDGATSGPIEESRMERWLDTGRLLAPALEEACG